MTLDGVTVQGVEQDHLKTLKRYVDKVNEDVARHEEKQEAEAERERQRAEQHEASLDEAMRRLSFE